ncbi:LCP family protein [Saxibacter everestensis]|uniref:LCP family protein n=1 Tax=Saxibacter everestensis TaxID=2909229 RepID=A0ABY8QQJ6_9MICO|nr:LCP family protein [Brevibacteriaceae bacterium ZFBP1038]
MAENESDETDRTAGARHKIRVSAARNRGRHNTGKGEYFPRVVTWTTVGTFIPGVALIAAGRKKLGGLILGLFIAGLIVLGAFVLMTGPMKFALSMAASPDTLLFLAIALGIGLAVWAAIIIVSYLVLRIPRQFTAGQRVLGGILVVSLVVIVGLPTGVASYYSMTQRSLLLNVFQAPDSAGSKQALDKEDPWKDKKRVNVFLMGRDDGAGRTGVRPDTLIVASIDTRSGETTLFSVPRNLAFPHFPKDSSLAKHFPQGFTGYGSAESLINAVWTWSSENPDLVDAPKGQETGLYATMQAVSGSLDLDIDYYATVNLKGFEDVVDAIGGVKIDVERRIPIGGGTNMKTGGKNAVTGYIEPGDQKLNGKTALWYVRSREGSDNYDRMCRQQRMIKTVLGQVQPASLATAFPRLAGSASKNIETDIPQQDLQAFVGLALKAQDAGVVSAQINNDVTSTVNPDYDELHKWVKKKLGEEPKKPKSSEESAGSGKESGNDSDKEPNDEASGESDQPASEETEQAKKGESEPTESAPEPGEETADGKCYPRGYNPNEAATP